MGLGTDQDQTAPSSLIRIYTLFATALYKVVNLLDLCPNLDDMTTEQSMNNK